MIDSQRDVERFMRCHGLQYDAATHTLDLVSEVGELAKLVLRCSDYGQRSLDGTSGVRFDPSHPMKGELGDVFYSLLALATSLGIDAGEALDGALRKYEGRVQERGGPGSS